MDQIVAVNPAYINLTHRIIDGLNESGLKGISDRGNIPIDDLKEFNTLARNPSALADG